jgi:CTP:molybdopterin cytidylyltransferase MocA/HD superfamily phosphohydrolase YqeK
MTQQLTAIILAAGYSSRMGEFKPLLPFGGTTVLERAIRLFREAGIHDIKVVVGHRSSELLPLLERLKVQPLPNERYQEGMFSSVLTAAASLTPESGAFFLLPVDIPLVRRETVELMARSYERTVKGILYPAFRGTPGHPPLISASYRDTILSWHGNGGLKDLLMQYESDTAAVETGDEGILLDMDTTEDYERLQRRLTIPSRQTCEELLAKRFAADSPVVGHCRAVENLTNLLAGRLNDSGCNLDTELIGAAALLHDLAKGEPRHATVGADILKGMGYDAVAELVAVHMDLPYHESDAITAADVLFLADKLMEGERFVPLETRFRRQLEQHADDLLILCNINRRLEIAREIQRRVEAHIGFPVADLLSGASP